MTRKLLVGLAVTVAGLTAAGVAIAANQSGIQQPTSVHYVWTLAHTNAFRSQPAPGDVWVFAGPISQNGHPAGAFRASCGIVVGHRAECSGTFENNYGTIDVLGTINFDTRSDHFGIVGGSGHYRNVRGEALDRSHQNTNKIDWYLSLQP